MKLKPLIILLVTIGLLIFLKVQFFSPENKKQPGGPAGKNEPVPVTAVVLRPENVGNRLFTTGSILANEEVILVPETAGRIIAISFTEGSRVEKGQLLVKINDADLRAQLAKLELQEKLASEKEARQKKLLDIKGVSQEEYDMALTELHTLRAEMEYTRAQIAKTEIRAPFSGIIGLKSVSEGSYATPASRIAAIQQTDPVKIDFSLPERYAGMIGKGDTIQVSPEGTGAGFTAVVSAVEPKVDISTRTLQVRAEAPNRSGKIFPGAFARIEIALDGDARGIMIPTEAVIPVLKGQKVFVSRNGKAEESAIETGIRTESKVQVLKGLSPGDTVLVTGIMQLKPGSAVNIISVK